MTILKVKALSTAQKEAVLQLWNNEYPAQLCFRSVQELEQYLYALSKPVHYIAGNPSLPCAAWAFAFERDGERWFAIIVDGRLQKTGIGTALLDALKADHKVLNGWLTDHDSYQKQDGQVYFSPRDFYLKNDFTLCPGERLETEKLSAVKISWSRS
ncbi:MAG: hypothetical protein JNL13_07005 [Chitinophagaceae bacterium]|nr:hypothetical protein [Chitinophagaceae bacterium]